jgi:hypothetical protein
MRGLTKTFAMLVLAGGMAMVPAIGSQGAGALGERHLHADAHLLRSNESPTPLHAADRLAESRVVGLTRS